MRTPNFATCVLLACAFCALGCSLINLTGFKKGGCATSSDCEALNTRDGLAKGTACRRWYCELRAGNAMANKCVIGPEDADGDGFPRCEVPADRLDCDDEQASVNPESTETCDGRDNNCNGIVDDSAFAQPAASIVAGIGSVQNVSFAPGAAGVSEVAWTSTMQTGQIARLSNMTSSAQTLTYKRNCRPTTGLTCSDSLTSLAGAASLADGCLTHSAPQPIACTTTMSCNSGGTALAWAPGLPGNGHVCTPGMGCDVCMQDSDCMPNTLPRTCNLTATASLCSSNAPAGDADPRYCCQGQLLNAGIMGGDPAACCPTPSAPRVCREGLCRDTCSADRDCPAQSFSQGVAKAIFGICLRDSTGTGGICIPPTRDDVSKPMPQTASCSFGDVARDLQTSVAGESWVSATVSTTGCARGALRIGVGSSGAPQDVVMLGAEARSNLYLGVDYETGATSRGCTGGSRPATEPRGAARPAVATLRNPQLGTASRPAQALVAYLGRGFDNYPGCPQAADHNVEALGTWFFSGGNNQAAFVTGTANGVPFVLGRTHGVERPAVTALGARGWVVAHPAGTGATDTTVALRLIKPLPNLPPLLPECVVGDPSGCTAPATCVPAVGADAGVPGPSDGGTAMTGVCRRPCAAQTDCPNDSYTCCLGMSCNAQERGTCIASARAHTARTTAPLEAQPAVSIMRSGGGAIDAVRVAVGRVMSDQAELGVVWQELTPASGTTCDVASGKIWFARLTIDLNTGALVGTPSTPIEVSSGAGAGGATNPSIFYADGGFLVPGRMATNIMGTVTEGNDGGWVVAWRQGSARGEILAQRVTELDGSLLERTPLTLTAAMPTANASVPHLFEGADMVRAFYAYSEVGTGAGVFGAGLLCRPAN